MQIRSTSLQVLEQPFPLTCGTVEHVKAGAGATGAAPMYVTAGATVVVANK